MGGVVGTRGVVAGVWVLVPATVVVGAWGALVDGWVVEGAVVAGVVVDDGATVVVVDVVEDVVEDVVDVVVVVGAGIRTKRGVTATLLRGPLSPPTTATIQHRDDVGGAMVSFVSDRPEGATLTPLRSMVITVSIGAFTVSVASSDSAASSSSFELRLFTHSTRYDSGVPLSNQAAFMARLLFSSVARNVKFFG